MNEGYKLITRRKKSGEEYSTEFYHKGKLIDLENPVQQVPSSILDVVSELTETDLRILSHFKEINKLETIISQS